MHNRDSIKKAIKDYSAGNYTSAYQCYVKSLDAIIENNENGAAYCEVGILQCQVMLGKISIIPLTNEIIRLRSQLSKQEQVSWVIECHRILDSIRKNILMDDIKKANYAYVVANNFYSAVNQNQTDEFFKNAKLPTASTNPKLSYKHNLITGLEIACQLYQNNHLMNDLQASKKLLARMFELVADDCLDEAEKFGPDNNTFSLLSQSLKYYHHSIETWHSMNIAPSFDLLLSTLHVCFTASNLLNIESYKKHFDLETTLDKYHLLQMINELSGHEQQDRLIEQLITYTGTIENLNSQWEEYKAMIPSSNKRLREETEQNDQRLKTARSSLEQHSVFSKAKDAPEDKLYVEESDKKPSGSSLLFLATLGDH